MKRIATLILVLLLCRGVSAGPDYWRAASTDYWYPIILVDETDGYTAETEKKAADTTITYVNIADGNTPASYTDSASEWQELGDGTGVYRLAIGAGEFTDDANDYLVTVAVSGCRTVRFLVRTSTMVTSEYATTEAAVLAVLNSYDPPTKAELDSGFSGLTDFDPNTTPVQVSSTGVAAVQAGLSTFDPNATPVTTNSTSIAAIAAAVPSSAFDPNTTPVQLSSTGLDAVTDVLDAHGGTASIDEDDLSHWFTSAITTDPNSGSPMYYLQQTGWRQQ